MSNCLVLNSSDVFGNNKNIFKFNFVNGMFYIKEGSEICLSNITILILGLMLHLFMKIIPFNLLGTVQVLLFIRLYYLMAFIYFQI